MFARPGICRSSSTKRSRGDGSNDAPGIPSKISQYLIVPPIKKHQIVYPVVYQYPIVYAYIYIYIVIYIYISQVLYIYHISHCISCKYIYIYIHSVMGTYDISHSQNMSHDPRDLFTAPNVRTSIAGARGRWMGKPWVVMAPEVYTRPGKRRKSYGIDGWQWPIYGWFTHENHGDFQWLCWITRYATTIQGDTRWCPISR